MPRRDHNSRRLFVLALACAVAFALAPLGASSPKFFTADSQAAFLKGDVENLSVDADGRLTLGPATELVYETPAPFLWSLVVAPDGSVFAGSGNEGKVYRVGPDGKGAVFFASPELEVHALALAPDGSLYVATSPNGRIYKVDRNGKGTPFFDPKEKYIWALATDASGNLYAGTGDKGVIYKITPDGRGAAFYKAAATHVTALAFDRSGNLLAGTGSPGRVLRIDPSGKPFVVLDSPFQEIHTLRVDGQGVLYAGAQASAGSTASSSAPAVAGGASTTAPAPSRAPVPTVSVQVSSVAVVDTSASSTTASTQEDSGSVKGAIYRIMPDGLWDEIWESHDDSPYDVAFDTTGALLVATGSKGKIYRLEGDPIQSTLVARASAQQVTAFSQDQRGRLYYATANPGKLFRLSADQAPRGTYESEPYDAQMVSSWGTIRWRGTAADGARIELYTRSGNTDTPDDTWSAWSGAYTTADGSPITSPKARYLQWRAVLSGKGDGPVLTSVTAAYLQRNVRPTVSSITVYPPGIVFQKPYSTGEPDLAGFEDQTTPERQLAQAAAQQGSATAMGRRAYQKGLQTLTWKADDANDDDLLYDVLYRREGETTWKVLRRGITDTIFAWDTTTVPNGTYFVKIVASDAPSNPPGLALTGERESASFEIDNTPPAITVSSVRAQGGSIVIAFVVTDDHSPIGRVEYSQDGQHWHGVFPVDGIADSRSERYAVTVDGPVGPRGLTLRAVDSMNNVATTQVQPPAGGR
jgi:sugar lactone lactonase YvrE